MSDPEVIAERMLDDHERKPRVDWKTAAGAACVVVIVGLLGGMGGSTLYDRYGPEPRQAALGDAVQAVKISGENLCDFASAFAHALDELALYLLPDQDGPEVRVVIAAIERMVVVADSCSPPVSAHDEDSPDTNSEGA